MTVLLKRTSVSRQFLKIDKSNPRKNLPDVTSLKRKESKFLSAFINELYNELNQTKRDEQFLIARELKLNGFGIADVIMINKADQPSESHFNRSKSMLSITAFEVKIRNWRKALRQAYRYKYYANKSIVVIPTEYSDTACAHIDVFKKLSIGLWIFDKQTTSIIKFYTPRENKPVYINANKKAFLIIKEKLKFSKFNKFL